MVTQEPVKKQGGREPLYGEKAERLDVYFPPALLRLVKDNAYARRMTASQVVVEFVADVFHFRLPGDS